MKREYRILESRPVTQYWEYIVKADSETEALNKVLDGEVEADEMWVEDVGGDEVDSDYEIYSDDDNDGDK